VSKFPTPRRVPHESAPITEADKLLSLKNEVLLQLDMASKAKEPNPTVIHSLALEGAMLEEKIAAGYVRAKKPEEAAINMVSAASCWVAAGKKTDALRALDRARELTAKDALLRWIKNYEKQVKGMTTLP